MVTKDTENANMYESGLAVRLHLKGQKLIEIADIFERSSPTFSGYEMIIASTYFQG
jgi:hypothetical protein